jgi:hypothetical protein
VRIGSGMHRVYGDVDAEWIVRMDNYRVRGLKGYTPAVGTIFETNRERDTGCEFTMELMWSLSWLLKVERS